MILGCKPAVAVAYKLAVEAIPLQLFAKGEMQWQKTMTWSRILASRRSRGLWVLYVYTRCNLRTTSSQGEWLSGICCQPAHHVVQMVIPVIQILKSIPSVRGCGIRPTSPKVTEQVVPSSVWSLGVTMRGCNLV